MPRPGNWQQSARRLKSELVALTLAVRDPRTPWAARLCVALVVGYAFSPIDLIPDPIPLLGYVDDLILLPLGIMLALRLIPPDVMADARIAAQTRTAETPSTRWVAVGGIVLIWLLLVALIARALLG